MSSIIEFSVQTAHNTRGSVKRQIEETPVAKIKRIDMYAWSFSKRYKMKLYLQ